MTLVRVNDITVGARIREDKGDIAGMAASLAKYGQIAAILVVGNGLNFTLICGERRLLAAQSLGWDVIEATVAETGLTEQERFGIEREENEQRKALTEGERAKGYRSARTLVEQAKATGPRLSSESEDKPPRGRATIYGVPKHDVAQALGVGVATLVAAEQHVAAVERYPELEPLPQQATIETAKTLDALPEPERLEARAAIAAAPREERRQVVQAEAAEGARILAIAGDPDGNIARAALRVAYSRAALQVSRALLAVEPEAVAETFDAEHRESAQHFIAGTRRWLDRLEAAISQGVHLVGGSR